MAGAKALAAKGIKAAALPADLGDPASVKAMNAKVRAALRPITVVRWTAVTGLVTAIQEALPDLRKEKHAAALVTNGGLGHFGPQVDAMGVQWNAMGVSIANSAKHELVGLLAEKLKADNV